MPHPDKAALVAAAVDRLREDAEALRESARQTREGAIHEESRAENDKDTRGLEASYLARGQAARVEEMEEAAAKLRFLELKAHGPDDPIGLSALVTVEVDGAEQRYFLVPVAGGLRVSVGGVEVQLLTPASPLGRSLVDKREGDDFELRLRGRLREYEIVEVE
jgi:transcription elongation GreA/GreB family factor